MCSSTSIPYDLASVIDDVLSDPNYFKPNEAFLSSDAQNRVASYINQNWNTIISKYPKMQTVLNISDDKLRQETIWHNVRAFLSIQTSDCPIIKSKVIVTVCGTLSSEHSLRDGENVYTVRLK